VQLARAHAMIGVNIVAADTDAEARRLATTQQMSVADLFRGARGLSKPPIDDIDAYWSDMERAQAQGFLSRSIVGSPTTVADGIAALIVETGADELMIVSDIFDPAARRHSYEIIAEAAHAGTLTAAAE